MKSVSCFTRLVVASMLVASAFAQKVKTEGPNVTAVTGESWLTHLHRSFDETSMGKTGRLGPPPESGREHGISEARLVSETSRGVILSGSDLYRLNCRGCHGEHGTGAPPEINSVINPVRATSATAVMERVKARGMELSRADAEKLAQQSKTMLLDRLHKGGQDMPAFPHLSEAEVTSLVAYLRQLAGVQGAERERRMVQEERVRVGELIAKSTCHICHSAAGPNPTPQQLYEGVIPPLRTLTRRTTQAEFVRKVTQGAPILMGVPPELMRGRMPVFYYLSEEEAADIYLYLTSYPPYPYAVLDAATAGSGTPPSMEDMDPPPRPVAASSGAAHTGPAGDPPETANADAQIWTFALLLGSLVGLFLILGFWFTVRELKRVSGERAQAAVGTKRSVAGAEQRPDPEMAA